MLIQWHHVGSGNVTPGFAHLIFRHVDEVKNHLSYFYLNKPSHFFDFLKLSIGFAIDQKV